jgi:hypothetical protein
LDQAKNHDEYVEDLNEKLRRQDLLINKYERNLMALQMSQASES